jgi:hypothetical protein
MIKNNKLEMTEESSFIHSRIILNINPERENKNHKTQTFALVLQRVMYNL